MTLEDPPSEARRAYIQTKDRLFHASCRAPMRSAHSAVTLLIQGVYEWHPEHARTILRHRIHCTGPATEMCRGMVKIAAKSITEGLALSAATEVIENARAAGADRELRAIERLPDAIPALVIPPLSARTAHGYMELAHALAMQATRREERHRSDRPIGAVLVSDDGELLGAAVNRGALNRTLHAELQIVQDFHARRARGGGSRLLPPGSTLYVTLKPCKMCAGMIWNASEDPRRIRVIFAEDDPGPGARRTILEEEGLLQPVWGLEPEPGLKLQIPNIKPD